jgi:hypothetical protein
MLDGVGGEKNSPLPDPLIEVDFLSMQDLFGSPGQRRLSPHFPREIHKNKNLAANLPSPTQGFSIS